MRVLLAEDEKDLNEVIKKKLTDESYAVDSVFNGSDALEYLKSTDYDVAVLDVMMPALDGFEVVSEYRKSGGNTPILLLTARDATEDRVHGLDSGADDYLVKPFSFPELLARTRVLLRRHGGTSSSAVISYDCLKLDPVSHKVERDGQNIDLSAKEFAVLEYLMRNPETVVTRENILSHAWSWEYDGVSNIVDVYIRYLRKKIDDPLDRKLINTIRGVGYILRSPE